VLRHYVMFGFRQLWRGCATEESGRWTSVPVLTTGAGTVVPRTYAELLPADLKSSSNRTPARTHQMLSRPFISVHGDARDYFKRVENSLGLSESGNTLGNTPETSPEPSNPADL